ncbi:MAG: hypothetical protein IJ904_07990, partial [Candidatus Methanomethylophilaceae archaeon]|nr:hypothetical protein [Candidatus Methanomethylophilaceae archaeon]
MKRGHSIAFAVMAVLAMVCAPLAAAGLGAGAEDTAIGTAFIPEPKEYLYDLWTDDNNVKILSVRASIGGSDLVEITGERTSKGPISGFWDFDRGTGLGPFNSFYAAINIADGLGEDNGERMLNHRAGTIAFVLDPYDLSKTLKGTTLTGTYNVMLVIPAVYWKADSNHLYISSSSSYKAGDMPVSGMVAYAHSLGDGKAFTNVFPYIGIGVYEATVVGDALLSVSGFEPTADKTCDEFKSCADNAVPADGSAYQQWNFYQWTLYKMMSYAVMGTKNSQAMMGDGPVNNSAASETGLADSVGPYADSSPSYSKLFIENPWGSLCEFVGDAAFCDKVLHAGNSLGGSALGEQTSEGASVARTGWITAASTDSSTWDLPISSQSASNAGDLGAPGDYVWSYSGWRSLLVGGSWIVGSYAGVAYLSGYDDLSFSNPFLGARLAYAMSDDVLPMR